MLRFRKIRSTFIVFLAAGAALFALQTCIVHGQPTMAIANKPTSSDAILLSYLVPNYIADNSWFASGEGSVNYFGFSTASAGDVNGDGFDDVLIGAPGYGNSFGRAYLYLGSETGLATSDSWSFSGQLEYQQVGSSVASAGDVNGDGYSDVLIGTWDFAGQAYLFFGSSTGLSDTPSWMAEGVNGQYFGAYVASAGDVNGDGYSDVMLSAHATNQGTGRVYLYYGSASGLSSSPGWTKNGEFNNDFFGQDLSAAGDVNDDGYSDVLVGAGSYGGNIGKAYLFLGSADGLASSDSWSQTGEASLDHFGEALTSAGDVNGDGFSDAVIASPGQSNQVGGIYLFLGSATGLSSADAWSHGGQPGHSFYGYAVSSAGDVDGDGYADVLVGANEGDQLATAYLYRGSKNGLTSAVSWSTEGEMTGDLFGSSVGSAGDVNNDGYDDLLIAALGHSSYSGRVYLFLDSVPPEVRFDLNAKPNGAYLKGSITIPATASDKGGAGLADVKIFHQGLEITSDATPPFLFAFDNEDLPNGQHTFKLRSSDRTGNKSIFATRTYNIDRTRPRTSAPYSARVKRHGYVKLYYSATDAYSPSVIFKIVIKDSSGNVAKTLYPGSKGVGTLRYSSYRADLIKGTYYFHVYATDKAGNKQYNTAKNRLVVS